jgi:uncharacterized protein (UPF0332 family)
MADKEFEKKVQKCKEEFDSALAGGEIAKSPGYSRFSRNFAKQSETSLTTAGILYDITNSRKSKDFLKVTDSYDGSTWVVVTSYYSMFYMARALVALKDVKIGDEGDYSIHSHVKNAFITLCIGSKWLEKRLGEDYECCKQLASDLIEERKKRGAGQYDTGDNSRKKDAELSIKRARNFFKKTRGLVS